jgi:hypothetical protein
MTDVFYETLQKKDSEHCMSIVEQILSPHDLNDLKWLQMTSIDPSNTDDH